MDQERNKASERSLRYYYKNKHAILEKNKNKPKIYCKCCEKYIKSENYEGHLQKKYHLRNEEQKNMLAIKKKYDDLLFKYNVLKSKYIVVKNKNK